MKIVLYFFVILGILVVAAIVYVRVTSLNAGQLRAYAGKGPDTLGDHVTPGGIKAVRAAVTDAQFDALLAAVAASDRTLAVESDAHAQVFVTRSKLWGLPDVATIWRDGETLHVHSHLVYGKADLGVNAARVRRWLASAGIDA